MGARHTALLLGDGEGRDLCWLSVVLAIKCRVHGEFAPEDKLALPSVACEHRNKHFKQCDKHSVLRSVDLTFFRICFSLIREELLMNPFS